MKMPNNENLRKKETFFRKKCFIVVGNKTIHFNEIMNPKEFKKMYLSEKLLTKIYCKINTNVTKPFLSLPTSECKKSNIKFNDLHVIRILKGNKSYELIAKIRSWGKIYVPRRIIDRLSINHHEKLLVEIVKVPEKSEENQNIINITDLFKNERKINVIRRAKGFVTIYKTGCLPITLPNNIKLTPELVEAFFLIHGDGHYKTKLFFVNNNPDLHNFIIKTFIESLKIPNFLWRGRMNINEKHSESFPIKYWLKNVIISKKQLYLSISKTKFNTSQQGNLRIVIDFLIVAEVFRKVFDFMKKNLNEELSFHALNGLLAAEGGAQIGKRGLHRITLSYNQEEKSLFENVMNRCSVLHLCKDRDEGNKGTFVLEKWERLYLFFDLFLSKNIIPFQLHKHRKSLALNGMLAHSFTKTMNKYLSKLVQQSEFSTGNLSESLNIRPDSCLSTIRKSQYSKFINIKGEGINRKPFNISISKQGKNFLNIISRIEQEAKT